MIDVYDVYDVYKVQMYAQERILEYWILNLVDNVLEVYRDPADTGEQAHYQTKLTFTREQQVSPLAFPECQIGFIRSNTQLNHNSGFCR